MHFSSIFDTIFSGDSMNQEKIGQFIKSLRKENNLTQKELADKYGVTYQAVSKWENGKNIPDIAILKEMSKDFNINIDDLLEGNKTKKNKKKYLILAFICILFLILVITIIVNKDDYEFKTLSTTCSNFTISGSISYNKDKSSIYISNIKYCGGDDNTIYDNIKATLYETHNDTTKKISDYKQINNITLEDYLQKLEFVIDNYAQACKNYTDNSLYIEILATENDKTTNYKIPLTLTSCE